MPGHSAQASGAGGLGGESYAEDGRGDARMGGFPKKEQQKASDWWCVWSGLPVPLRREATRASWETLGPKWWKSRGYWDPALR